MPSQYLPAQSFTWISHLTLGLGIPRQLLWLMWASPDISPSTGDSLPTEGRLMNSCIQARRKCQANPTCNAAYHHLSSCTSSVSTSSPAEEPSVSLDCFEAAQHLRNSSLMSCTCHRRMKNQTACLDIYWTVHPARSLGEVPILEWTKLEKMAQGWGVLFNSSVYEPPGRFWEGCVISKKWREKLAVSYWVPSNITISLSTFLPDNI